MGEIKHLKVSDIPENVTDAPGVVGPTDWNADHDVTLGLGDLVLVDDTGADIGDALTWDGTEWIPTPSSTKMFAFMGW